MGRIADRHEEPPKFGDISNTETAVYVCDLLDSLQRVCANQDMRLLAHLIGLAKAEAKRCSSP